MVKARFTPSLSLGRYTNSVRKAARATRGSRQQNRLAVQAGRQLVPRVAVVVGVTPVTTTIGMQVPQ